MTKLLDGYNIKIGEFLAEKAPEINEFYFYGMTEA